MVVREAMPPRRDASILLLLVLAGFLAHQAYYNYLADDAFIGLRYVRNLVSGHGLVYNVGERVEGYTNFLWLMLLSLPAAAGADVVLPARVLGAVSGLATLVATYVFSRRSGRLGPAAALLAPGLLASNAAFAVWTPSGMETPLFALLVLLAFSAFVGEWEAEAPRPVSAVLFALAALTRWEALLLAAVTAAFRFGRDLRARRRPFRASLTWLGVFLVLYVPYFVWRWRYYGWLLPNTYYDKVGGDYYVYLRGLFYGVKFVTAFGGLVLFALPLALFVRRRTELWVWYAAALVLAWSGYIIFVGGDGLVSSRFFVPVLPLIYLLVQGGVYRLTSALAAAEGDNRRGRWIQMACAVVVLAATLNASYNVRRDPYLEVVGDRETIRSLIKIGRWLKAHSRPEDSIALYVAGAIPYYSGLYAIDMHGKTDEYIAHRRVPRMGRGTAGHEKLDWEYVLARAPTYIMADWPTPVRQSKDPLVTKAGRLYNFRSVRIGEGTFLDRFRLRPGELWFNYWELAPARR